MKVVINKLPSEPVTSTGEKKISVNKTIQPVERKDANVEAEKNEVLLTSENFDGLPELYVIGGHSHAEGGTPLNIPVDSFIFSKDKSLKLKDEELLKSFGKKKKPSGYTMAELAKQYDINEYRKVLADPNSDMIQKKTAEAMIAKYNEKLGKLALVQESMKGFEDGIPAVAMPFIYSTGFDPSGIMDTQGMEETTDQDVAKYGGLIKAQYGKGIKPAMIPAYDAEEQYFLKKLSPDVVLPEDLIPDPQGKNAKVYGDFQANQADQNWAWYGKKIDWGNPQEVGEAQKAYNDRIYDKMKKAGYSNKTADLAVKRLGFVADKGVPNSLDNLAGKYTETRKDFDISPVEKSVTQAEKTTKAPELDPIKTNRISFKQDPNNAKFWTQDILNTFGAFKDLNSIKKYLPYEAPVNLITPESTYYDPTRELASVAEQANIADLTSAMFAGPQRMAANALAIQGKAGESAANVMAKYNNLNVGIANQNAAMKADIYNKNAQIDADRATNLQMQTNLVNQQFDAAKMMLRKNMRDALNTALTNRGKTQALNSMNEQYNVDPVTGNVYFKKARPFDVSKTNNSGDDALADKIANLMRNIPGLSSETAYKIATGNMK